MEDLRQNYIAPSQMLIVDMPIQAQCIPCKHHATTEILVEDRGSRWKFFSEVQEKVKFGAFFFF